MPPDRPSAGSACAPSRPGRRRGQAPLGRPGLAGTRHRPGPHGRDRGRRPRPGPRRPRASAPATASPRPSRSTSRPAGSGSSSTATAVRSPPATSASRSTSLTSERGSFEVICEIEPATTPDLTRVRHQIGVLSPVATTFLIPDNHIGRATVSSVAVAHEVQADGRALHRLPQRPRPQPARVPARSPDRGGLRRGPVPLRLRRRAAGRRPHQRAQRAHDAGRGARLRRGPGDRGTPMRFGAATGLRPLPTWKRAADFLCVQIGFSARRTCWPGGPRSRSTFPSTPGSSSWPAPAWPAT